MPEIEEARLCRAPARQVWKLLYDPVRFASWWPGWERVDPGEGDTVTRYDARWPDFSYPTNVTTDPASGRVVISCLLSDIVHEWVIEPSEEGCRVGVRITIPEEEASRQEELAANLAKALSSLVDQAEHEPLGPGRG